MQEQAAPTATRKPFKWGFASSGGVILALMIVGQVAGDLLARWPPMRGLMRAMGAFSGQGSFEGGVLEAMVARDWLFGAFLIAAAAVAWFNRDAILRFFRAMHTGVMLITLSTIAVGVGVLVPQIDNFEDPQQRITAANHAEEQKKFRLAEGYFFYHLTHLYGFGMPEPEVPPAALQGLERFGRVYGAEERKNREVMMRASISGQAKSQEISEFVGRHRELLNRAFEVCTRLDLNRTYKSSWFATLMGLLFLGVLINTFRYPLRTLFSVEKAGFLVTHAGMLTLLSGGLVSNLFTDRGILELRLGEPAQDTYYRHYRNDQFARMPFAVKLDSFARKEWKALEVHFLAEQFTSKPPIYTVWPGRRIPLDWQPDETGELRPQWEFVVREVHDQARAESLIREGTPGDGGTPLAVAQFDAPAPAHRGAHGNDGHDHENEERGTLVMAPDFMNRIWVDPEGAFRLNSTRAADPRTAFPAEGDDAIGTLDVDVMSAGLETPTPMRFRVGDTLALAGGYRIVVRNATRNFRPTADTEAGPADLRPLAEQPDGFRAVWVEILPPDGKEPERRLISEDVDAVANGLQDRYRHKEVVAKLRWDRWTEPGAPRFVFSWNPGGAKLTAEDGSERAVAVGEEVDLPGHTRLVLTGLFEHARPETKIEFLPNRIDADGFDPSFYRPAPRGIAIDVLHHPGTPRESLEQIRLTTLRDSQVDWWKTPDNRLAIVFLENTEGFPFDWRSVLSIVEKDAKGNPVEVDCGTPKQREIRVNDYFSYKGYRFFQTNANAKDPDYSGIGVVYDPGIEIVLAGMYTIIAGTVLAFSVRPIVRARRRAGVNP